MEEKYRSQIEDDWTSYVDHKLCYLLTEETIKYYNWTGLMISQQLRNARTPEELKFENLYDSHLLLRIHQDMSINEFIIMLRERFYPELDLEDIWVYRVL
jgi:hypothetical protein